jgi:flavin-dependent dehydrogenase
MNPGYDVVVVGGRVAGAATALLLARQGLSVLVLERETYGSDTTSTHALLRTGVMQLHRWGLLDRLIDAGVPPVRASVFHYAGGDAHVALRPAGGVDALYAPRRTTLDAMLVDAAVAAGADVRHGWRATSLFRDLDGRVAGVLAADHRGRPVKVAGRMTVAADGLHSRIAKWVGAPMLLQGTASTGVVYGYFAGVPSEGYEWAYRGRASAGFIPTQGGLTCVFAATSAPRFRTLAGGAEERFAQLLAEAAPSWPAVLDGARRDGRLRGFGGHPGFLRRAHGPGWALVGDAGYYKDPLSAHGLSDALRDAELLTRAIVPALSGRTPEAIALAGYQRRRDELSRVLFGVTEQIAAHDWTEERVRQLLRELSAAISDEFEALTDLDRPAVA